FSVPARGAPNALRNRLQPTASGALRVPRTDRQCASGRTAPTVSLSAGDFVQISHTPNLSSEAINPPEYSIRVAADGAVLWNGVRNVRSIGAIKTTVAAEGARALIERYRANGFWDICGDAPAPAGANRTTSGNRVTLGIGGQEWSVTASSASPAWLPDLEHEADRLVGAYVWLYGDPSRPFSYGDFELDHVMMKPGVTPLMMAGAIGDLRALRALLASKVDPNTEDSSGWTALMYAAAAHRNSAAAAATQSLLEGGADPNRRSHAGQTAVMAHVIQNMPSASDAAVPALRLLIAAGADVNAADNNGQTALHTAMRLPNVNLLAFLRDAGARTDIRDASGQTAMDLLNAQAQRSANPAQLDNVRRLLQQPARNGTASSLRLILRPTAADIREVTLERLGDASVPLTAVVRPDGSAEFPAVAPGAYSVRTTPTPLFDPSGPRGGRGANTSRPIALPLINVAGAPAEEIEIVAPAVREVHVRATIAGDAAMPVFYVLVAALPRQTPPSTPGRGRGGRGAGPARPGSNSGNASLSPAMEDSRNNGATLFLFQAGSLAFGLNSPESQARMPSIGGSGNSFNPMSIASELTRLSDNVFRLPLLEGDYAVMALAPHPERVNFQNAIAAVGANGLGPAETLELLERQRAAAARAPGAPATSDNYTATATSDGMDLASNLLHVTRSGQEIEVTFIPLTR
ncbi:MAG TPA: ankyrin repeat domain-containing protein, partial [Terriglobia bacterium]|nr:ankyrin repeat domain-containing protein [Terriglobia bacterium]